MTVMPSPEERQSRQRRLAGLRRVGLLGLAERLAYWRALRASRQENAAFIEAHPDFAVPPLRWMHDMYNHTSYAAYLTEGRVCGRVIGELIDKHLGEERYRVAEWGCGMGRVLRHLAPRHDIAGFDYNPAAVEWCREALPGEYRKNALMPPLPAPEKSIDALFGISVFTHLSAEAHEAWIAELARVLRPGGLLIVTMHGDPAPGQLLPEERERFDAGRIVTRGFVREGSRLYTAYQPEPYVHRLFEEAGFDILEGPRAALGQTLYAARRKS